jgi:hypothetical protein
LAALLVAGAWALGLLVAGCTSDPANPLGAGLIDNQIDSTLLEIDVVNIDNFAGLRVDNANVKVPAQQALYAGSEGGNRASFVVNFDFSDIFSDDFPAELFQADSIKSVKFSLTKLLPYVSRRDSAGVSPTTGLDTIYRVPTGQPLNLYFFVHELQAPFDPLAFEDYPTATPPFSGPVIIQNFETPNTSSEPTFTLYEDDFLRWVASSAKVGMIVQLSDLSDPGLVGFASGDLKTYSQVPDVAVGTVVGPNIIVEFEDRLVNKLVPPAEDTTVFEQVAPAPADLAAAAGGFVLRTGLRSYPAIRFSTANLPVNALVNRAVLSVANDTSLSFGPAFSVMVSEIVAGTMDDPSGRMDASAILDASRVFPLSLNPNLRANQDVVIEFDVTTGVRRMINQVNDDVRGFLLSGIERRGTILQGEPAPDPTLPDFYFRQMNFLGLSDPDHRPQLKVWYSVVNELAGGGQ